MKWIIRLFLVLFILLLCGVGALFLPSVQKAILVNALSPTYGEVKAERVALGLSSAQLTDFSIRNNDFTLALPHVALRYNLWDLIKGTDIYLQEVSLKDGYADFSAITDWEAVQTKYFGESEKQPFNGVFTKLENLMPIGLESLSINSQIILPDQQTVQLSIKNKSTQPREPSLALNATLKDQKSNQTVVSLAGSLGIEVNESQRIQSFLVEGTVKDLVNNNNLRIEAELAEKPTEEIYRAALYLPQNNRPVFVTETTYAYGKNVLAGNYSLQIDSQNLPQVAGLQDLPQFLSQGDGQFTFSLAQQSFSIQADLKTDVRGLGAYTSSVDSLDTVSVDLALQAKGNVEEITLEKTVGRINTSAGKSLLQINIPDNFVLRKEGASYLPTSQGAWGSITLTDIPLALVGPLLAEQKIATTGGSVQGTIDILRDKERIALQTNNGLALTATNLRYDGKPIAANFRSRLEAKADFLIPFSDLQLDRLVLQSFLDKGQLTLTTTQRLALDNAPNGLPNGILLTLAMTDVPLQLVNNFSEGVKIAGRIASQTLHVEKRDADWVLSSPKAANISIDSLSLGNEPTLSGVRITTQPQIVYANNQIGVSTGDTSLASARGEMLLLNLQGQASVLSLLSNAPTGKVAGTISVDLGILSDQPVVPADARFSRGKITSIIQADWDKEPSLNAEVRGAQIVSFQPNAPTIRELFLNLDARQTNLDSWAVKTPLMISTNQGETNVSLLADVTLHEKQNSFSARLTGKQVIVDDLLLFAALGGEKEATKTAPASSPADSSIPWEGWQGQLNVDLEQITYRAKELDLRNFKHTLNLTENKVTEKTSFHNLYGGSVASQSALNVVGNKKGFSLLNNFSVQNIDSEKMFSALKGKASRVFTGTLSGNGTITSKANTLETLADNLLWDATLNATNGSVQMLGAITERLPFGGSKQTQALQQGLGALGGILAQTGVIKESDNKYLQRGQAALQAAQLLSNLPYDQLKLRVNKPQTTSPLLVEAQSTSPLFRMALQGQIAQTENVSLMNQPLQLVMDLGAEKQLKQVLNELNLLKAPQNLQETYLQLKEPIKFNGTLNNLVYQEFIARLAAGLTGL